LKNAPLHRSPNMKFCSTLILFVVLTLTFNFTAHAQTADAIWIQADTTAYKTNETAVFTINGIAATSIQGFTAQIRYDPACLQPVSSTSPVTGMNGLALPQESGLVDVSFASTTPINATGILAIVRFTTLKACQTSLSMESAALVIRNESGFAVPLPGVNIIQNPIALTIDGTLGAPQPETSGEPALPLAPTSFPKTEINWWKIALMIFLAAIPITIIIVAYKFTKPFDAKT